MAQSGYTPILIYASGTATNVPLAANLTSSASGAELALNYADGKLYFKNSSGVVTLLAGSGGGGPAAGSNTQIQFNNSGVFGASANLTWSGTVLSTTGLTATGAILHNTTTNNQSYTTTGAGTITISSGTTGSINNMNIGATTAGTGTFTSLSDSGNLTFTGTGNRITGDFSNATLANRVYVQTSTTNSNTNFGSLPNGTATVASLSAWNNSDPTNASFFVIQANGSTDARLNSGITGTGTYLPMTFYTGGSEQARITISGGVSFGSSGTNYGTSGQVLTSAGNAPPTWTTPTTGTVTSVSVVSANGFTGSVATATTTPAITLTTSVSGVLKGNGTAISAATAGTDYVGPSTATTFTATQTLNGSSSTLGSVLLNAAETTTVSATAATGTINFYLNSQSVLYYTSNASANWTLNVAFSSGTSLDTAMSAGQTVTLVFMVTQGATAYYASALQIDGASVTPKYQGGTAWSAGNASGIDVYSYTITKTASATYTVFASQTQFK